MNIAAHQMKSKNAPSIEVSVILPPELARMEVRNSRAAVINKLNKAKYQYSDLVALPVKCAYFENTDLIASPMERPE